MLQNIRSYVFACIILLPIFSGAMFQPFRNMELDYKPYTPLQSKTDGNLHNVPLSPISKSNPKGIYIPVGHEELHKVTKAAMYDYVKQDSYHPEADLEAYVENDLSLIDDFAHKTAIVIFENPKKPEFYHLTDQEIDGISKLVQVCDAKVQDKYVHIAFKYGDKSILPETRAQAIYLLYCFCASNVETFNQLSPVDQQSYASKVISPLNATQKNALYQQPSHQENTLKRKSETVDSELSSINKCQKIIQDLTLHNSYSVNDAQTLFNALSIHHPIDLAQNREFYQQLTHEIDHTIALLHRTSDPHQQMLHAMAVSSLVQLYDQHAFDHQEMPDASNQYHQNPRVSAKIAHAALILALMNLPVQEIIAACMDCIRELMQLAQMLVDIAITTGEQKFVEIQQWSARIYEAMEEKYKEMPAILKIFASLTQDQLSTILTHEYMRALQEGCMQGRKFLDVPIQVQEFLTHFFKNFFDPCALFKPDGTILDIAQYAELIRQQLQECAVGLAPKTLVKMADGSYKTIDQLKIGDWIKSFNHVTGQVENRQITAVGKETVDSFFKFVCRDGTFFELAPGEQVYVSSLGAYFTAEEIKNSVFLAQSYKEIVSIQNPQEVIKITVDGNHNFYVTEKNILVHNYAYYAVGNPSYDTPSYGGQAVYQGTKISSPVDCLPLPLQFVSKIVSEIIGYCVFAYVVAPVESLNIGNGKILARPLREILNGNDDHVTFVRDLARPFLQNMCSKVIEALKKGDGKVNLSQCVGFFKRILCIDTNGAATLDDRLAQVIDLLEQAVNVNVPLGSTAHSWRVAEAARILGKYVAYIDRSLFNKMIVEFEKIDPEFAKYFARAEWSEIRQDFHDTIIDGSKALAHSLKGDIQKSWASAKQTVTNGAKAVSEFFAPVNKMDPQSQNVPAQAPPADAPKEPTTNQPGLDPEDPVSISKQKVDNVLKGAEPVKQKSCKTQQFEKPGTFQDAKKEFEAMGLSDIKDIDYGKVGTLLDGRTVNVRIKSSGKQYPTLEIYDPVTKISIKIRYLGGIG